MTCDRDSIQTQDVLCGTGRLKLTGMGLVCFAVSKYEPKGNIHDQPTSLPTRARTFKFVSFPC